MTTVKEFYDACLNGEMHVIDTICLNFRGVSNYGMGGACRGGQLSIVKLMIENGADDWNYGLFDACRGGHLGIVQLMISKGADGWYAGFEYACEHGHLSIVEFMISKGIVHWNSGLFNASLHGHLHIIKRMISLGATNIYELTREQAYQLLEMGQSIQTFASIEKFQELIKNIQSFREKVLCVSKHYLLTDLSAIIARYSLK